MTTTVEWLGAMTSLPSYVTGEGEPFKPEALVWMVPGGPIVHTSLGRPGELLGDVKASLDEAIASLPQGGRVPPPNRIRVASEELARALRAGVGGSMEIVAAPTPEMDVVLESLRAHMSKGGSVSPSYLDGGIEPDAVAGFFRAAARLWRQKPWEVVPTDEDLFAVSIPTLGIDQAVACVLGQLGESHAVLLFESEDAFESYLAAIVAEDAAAIRRRGTKVPPHLGINFDRGADLPKGMRREVAEHGWEVAAPHAYPSVLPLDEDLMGRPPTSRDVAIAECLAYAIAEVMERERHAVLDAFEDGGAFQRTVRVPAHGGEVAVELTVLAGFHDDEADIELDEDEHEAMEEELIADFAESPEAEGLDDMHACRFLLDYGFRHLGKTYETMNARDVEEVIFELVPEKVCVDPSEAPVIIQATRALYEFLARTTKLPQAAACLRVLGGDAAERLADALGDPSCFGMAKSMMMAGKEAGYDVRTEKGLQDWMSALASGNLGATPARGGRSTSKPDPKKKKARKAARKARRKSR